MAYKDDIIDYVNNYYEKYGISPSIREIAEGIVLAKSSVQRYLVQLSEEGKIEYGGKRGIRTQKMMQKKDDQVRIGKVGSITCGPLAFAEQNITEYYNFSTSLVGNGEFFMLEACGDSMVNAGIDDGDLVIIKKQSTADDGQIVVALHGDETTLKRFYKDREHKRFILHPENDRMEDIIIEDDIQIQGVAVKILKEAI
ncbi:MAG: transcriptional repressor LexA [Candidatus Onthovivens sp.]|nr:transcriptional repressor LexA [Candidatus Onthovivens sp.]